ncbi:hypothetical protein [uncultured Paraglaciecola sp.]|uniref:hypothetical protein n=1 Tax=uncultured Paraglaciecola sp. TaxID=1765024 RepID=UPI00262E2BF0|nr:hypothetical protein [uncultured Paraglaciecola sp.]
MNCNSSVDYDLSSGNHNTGLAAEHYTTMDLCSQAQMFEDSDNILSRMNKLRIFAKEQQAKAVQPQKRQRSFCFM